MVLAMGVFGQRPKNSLLMALLLRDLLERASIPKGPPNILTPTSDQEGFL